MHEHSVMNNLMNKILSMAEKQKAIRVTKVCVRLGALSHMSSEHFKEHFEFSAKGTIAQDAIIEAEESSDVNDPYAQTILLKSIDIAN
ncbi:MAG: hydrogenase maturation nickel metallochaperone HypA [Verrucomicrobia bacterium]|nr:hydrogenase maturation nickel metallochaperone HypA [Verrucomicrobiota bacterium]